MYNDAVTAAKAVKRITTKKWIILATTSNRVKEQTGTIAVASIQRYDDAVTAAKAVGRTTRVGKLLISSSR